MSLASIFAALAMAKASDADAAKLCCSVFPPEPPSSLGTQGEQFTGIGGVAVNVEGNGPGASPGDIYVVDRANNRVQQLHETPDGDGRRFVRAFGLDVGGVGVNVCTVAASCQAGTASGAAGGMSEPIGIAVDQTNGNLYVTDNVNHRIDVFRADGVFEGAFGWKVNAALPAEELQFCTTGTGCQAGSVGGGAGQFGERGGSVELRSIGHPAVAPTGAPDAGNVVVADSTNNRVDEFSVTLNVGKEVTAVAFVAGMGWKVNSTAPLEAFQTCTTATGCQAGSPGGGVGQFTDRGLTRVGVNATGAIYAVNSPNVFNFCNTTTRHCHVQKINSERTAASEFAPTQLSLAAGIVQKVAPSEITVDPISGDAYVARPKNEMGTIEYQILRFDTVGNLLEIYPPSGGIGVKEKTAFGLSLDYLSGSLYLSTTTGGQRIYLLSEPPPIPPTTTTGVGSPGANFSLENLEGTVNPEGFRVLGCRFEYGTTTAYGVTTPCVPSEPGEGTGPVAVSAETEPLEPSRTYHYRLVAENGGPIGFGEDRTFTSAPALTDGCVNAARRAEQGIVALVLPECMALEMVSPPQKGGQAARLPGVSVDGSRVNFTAVAALGEDPPDLLGGFGTTYVATRHNSGWSSESTMPGQELSALWESALRPSFTPDYSRWLGISANAVQVQRGIAHAYEGGLGGFFKPLAPLIPLTLGDHPAFLVVFASFQGASTDHSHLYFRPGGVGVSTYLAGDPTLGGLGAERANTYLARINSNNQQMLELLNRDRNGKVWGGNCGARLGGFGPVNSGSPARNGERNQGAVSPDGSRTYLSARASQPVSGNCEASSKLRILERLETPSGPQITPLFSSECSRVSPPCSSADGDDLYQGASADQTKVYFTTNRQLTNTDLDGSSEECKTETAVGGCDLYLYDRSRPAGERLVQVSAGEELGAGVHEAGKEAKVFNGITAISGDGSHVYFVARGVLTNQPNPEGETAQASEPNLYLWDAESEIMSFLGTLVTEDGVTTSNLGFGLWGGQGTWRNDAYPVPVTGKDADGEEIGGDGHILFFESQAELTSADDDGTHLDVYRYDADAIPASLQCISCKPGGPDSAPFDVDDHGESQPGGTNFAEEGRWVSEDGQTAGFLTPEGLMPGDVNGDQSFYLWQEGALVRLLGRPFVTGGNDGPLLSHDGSTIAFATQSQLLPQDGDATADVYVARVDGGFSNPAAPMPCEPGGGCQQKEAAPKAPNTTSKAFRPGNPKPKPANCPKGKVRRKGRCVPKHPHKNKGKAKKKRQHREANANRRAGK